MPERARSASKGRSGFTLVELLIVVAIISILAAIAIPNLQRALLRSRVSRMASDAKTLYKALVQYNVDRHAYPPVSGSPEAFNLLTLEPLVRNSYLPGTAPVVGTLQGRAVSDYDAPTVGSENDQFWAVLTLGAAPVVQIVVADTTQFPGFEGQSLEGAYFVHDGKIHLLDEDILRILGR